MSYGKVNKIDLFFYKMVNCFNLLLTICACISLFKTVNCDQENEVLPSCVVDYYYKMLHTDYKLRNYDYYHEMVGYRIVGGQSTNIRQAPYQLMFGLYCGAVLIAPQWALTAAHCKYPSENKEYVLSGATYRNQGTVHKICHKFKHPKFRAPGYRHYFDYDFQLLLLKNPVTVTDNTMPIALAVNTHLRAGDWVKVTGFGYHTDHSYKMSEDLQEALVPVISAHECRALPNKIYHITPRMFCAGFLSTGAKDACQGDSGGPAVYEGRLVGLVSFGSKCALPDNPGVYSSVRTAVDWIEEITQIPFHTQEYM